MGPGYIRNNIISLCSQAGQRCFSHATFSSYGCTHVILDPKTGVLKQKILSVTEGQTPAGENNFVLQQVRQRKTELSARQLARFFLLFQPFQPRFRRLGTFIQFFGGFCGLPLMQTNF